MVGNRNHPLNQRHYDKNTLEEFVLGQLLPDEEEQIRQHLASCPLCRATVADIHAFCQRISSELTHDLEAAKPGPNVSFDRIAAEWRKPPRRVTWLFKLQQLAPGASYILLIALLTTAFVMLFPASDTTALDKLDLAHDYDGPPAIVAAMTDDGLAVVKLAPGEIEALTYLDHVRDPRNLQFSPDGQWLAFQDRSTLHIIQPMHDDVRIRVYVHDRAEWAWSPDSQKLAYTNGIGQLSIFDVSTRTNQVIVPAEESAWGMPVWTDDSTQIAYTVIQPLSTDTAVIRQGIWRIMLDTGYRVEITRNTTPGEKLLVPVDWSSDNTTLLAWDMNAGTGEQNPNLYRVDVNNHEATPLAGHALTQGSRLAWPVSASDTTLA
ncbi:MAG: PD40 domain-containing protein, partial [Anaerolineae bacterium]|nr:PD40 domain-containing protein [Anaerolineae bacterium]